MGRARLSWAFDLSPITIIEEEGSTVESLEEPPAKGESAALLIARRVALETDEWIPPQRPLSEEMTTKSLFGVGLSDGTWVKTSVRRIERK